MAGANCANAFFRSRGLEKTVGDWLRDHVSTDWKQRTRNIYAGDRRLVSTQVLLERFILKRFAEDTPVAVVLLKTHWEIRDQQHAALIEQTGVWINSYSNASLIDTTGPLKKRMASADYIFYGDEHPNAKVHDLYAQVIYASLPPLLRRYGLR